MVGRKGPIYKQDNLHSTHVYNQNKIRNLKKKKDGGMDVFSKTGMYM